MCSCNEKEEGCQNPQNLKGKREKRPPEQVRKCHGERHRESQLAHGRPLGSSLAVDSGRYKEDE